MKIRWVTVGLFEENSYVVADEQSGDAVLIDPGDEPARIIKMVDDLQVTPRAIWLTHAHIDHVGAIAGVKRRWNIPVHLHEADSIVYDNVERVAAAYGMDFDVPPPPDKWIAEGDVLTVGAHSFTVWHVPGHAPGHVIYIGDGVMLGGDLLFAGSIGRVDLPFADPLAMQASLSRLSSLPPGTTVYPGHGPETTIGNERAMNPYLNGTMRLIAR